MKSLYLCTQFLMEKMRKSILFSLLTLFFMGVKAQNHTEFVRLSLEMSPWEMANKLVEKGLTLEDSVNLHGRIAGLEVWLHIEAAKDTASCAHIMLSTRHQQGHTQRDDYKALRKWMHKHYGAPQWESTVRGHAFARWYVGFDRDIVMIATATPSIEIWFYDNHKKRNIDYYAILKYCERNPSDDVPFMTAQECVTWHDSVAKPIVRKNVKSRYVRKPAKGRRSKAKVRRRRH